MGRDAVDPRNAILNSDLFSETQDDVPGTASERESKHTV